MNLRYLLPLFVWSFQVQAEAPGELPGMTPVLGQPGEMVYAASFDGLDMSVPKTKLGKLEVADGVLRLEERKADHHQAAVSLYDVGNQKAPRPLHDFLMRADFQWDGARDFQIGFNRMGGLAKKAADGTHWEVAPHCLTIAFRQPAEPTKRHEWVVQDNSVEPFVDLGNLPLILESGRWYRILIEVKGEEVSVQLSNGQAIRGKAKNPDDPKAAPILRCQSEEGKGVLFDNIQVWTMK